MDILDVSDPHDIRSYDWQFSMWDMPYFTDIEIIGNYLLTSGRGFKIFDISDPSRIVLVGYYDVGFSTSICVSENLAYVSTMDNEEIYIFDISHFLEPSYTTDIERGWNLLSWPFEGSTSTTDLPGSIVEPVYIYDPDSSGYIAVDSLSGGEGYWTLSERDTLIEFADSPPLSWMPVHLQEGWNLLAGPYIDMAADKIDTMEIIIPPIYGFEDGSYHTVDTLYPFCGYWILANDSATVELPVFFDR